MSEPGISDDDVRVMADEGVMRASVSIRAVGAEIRDTRAENAQLRDRIDFLYTTATANGVPAAKLRGEVGS